MVNIPDKNEVIEFVKSIYKNETLINEEVFGVKVDLYFPKKKIAIKLDGYFWNKDAEPRKETKVFMDNGVRLIHIYDYEWVHFADNFKGFIESTLNSRYKHMIRSTEVKEIEREEFIKFLTENHMFGNTIAGCSWMYGIYDNGELVAVSGFDKKSRKYNFEWKRFCIKYGWMGENIPQLFLDEFSKEHKGILVDYQQIDRFCFSTDASMGFKRIGWNSGVVCINDETLEFTRHSFIPEKPLNKQETMEKYGFNQEVKNAGTITWVKELI